MVRHPSAGLSQEDYHWMGPLYGASTAGSYGGGLTSSTLVGLGRPTTAPMAYEGVSAVPMKGRCEELGISSLFVLCLLVLVTAPLITGSGEGSVVGCVVCFLCLLCYFLRPRGHSPAPRLASLHRSGILPPACQDNSSRSWLQQDLRSLTKRANFQSVLQSASTSTSACLISLMPRRVGV